MVYDRDLKWFQRANWAVLVLNGGGAIQSALRHEWWVAGAYLVWCGNIWMWREMMKSSQRTRDAMRLISAAVSGTLTTRSESEEA